MFEASYAPKGHRQRRHMLVTERDTTRVYLLNTGLPVTGRYTETILTSLHLLARLESTRFPQVKFFTLRRRWLASLLASCSTSSAGDELLHLR